MQWFLLYWTFKIWPRVFRIRPTKRVDRLRWITEILKKYGLFLCRIEEKRLTTVFFINVSSDIKRCIQFTVKIKMKTFNRIPASCFRVSAECSVSYIILAILNALGDGDLRKTSIKETSQLMSVLVNDIFNISQNETSQVHITWFVKT